MLSLEIEFLTGVARIATNERDGTATDWPPQPDRIFSALVAAWGTNDNSSEGHEALEWLEQQPAPRIIAGEISQRTTPEVYVPLNNTDLPREKVWNRMRQDRRFPAGSLQDPIVTIVWESTAEKNVLENLQRIARNVAYVGHSSSLTRCSFSEGDVDVSKSIEAKRIVYKGRLAELEDAYRRGERPQPGHSVIRAKDSPKSSKNPFSQEWLIFESEGGVGPDLYEFAPVARILRRALMGKFDVKNGVIPEWLSGHTIDGSPSRIQHLAILPLADVGWEHAEGRVMGVALVLPKEIDPRALDHAVNALFENDDSQTIHVYDSHCRWRISYTESREKKSLRPDRWLGQSKTKNYVWTTATPVVLGRRTNSNDPEKRRNEITGDLAESCLHSGLPRPARVLIHVYSRLQGSHPSVRRPKTPAWQSWKMPENYGERTITHATFVFDEPVDGPVIIGAGRYLGMGMCLPIDTRNSE